MTHPDPSVLRALASLETIAPAEFRAVMGWLRALLYEAREADIVKDETMLRWHQGQAQALHHVVTTAEKARETLRKIT